MLETLDVDWSNYHSLKEERCGFVLKDGSLVEVPNQAENKQDYFVISTEDIDKYADQILSSWHTHAGTNANLSMSDYVGFVDSEIKHHIIIAKSIVALFSNTDKGLMLGDWKKYD